MAHSFRLDKALANQSSQDVVFRLRLAPYQLYPSMPTTGEAKRAWYTREKYSSEPAKFDKYEILMNSYAAALGFQFSWDGDVANTLDAHRVIQVFQGDAEELEDEQAVVELGRKYGRATAERIQRSIYRQYFEEGRHPSADETLLRACAEAGVDERDAQRVVVEDRELGRRETSHMVKLAGINGVDSVPTIVFEGRRRDLTLVGAKEVEEYEKAHATIIKESS